MWPATILGSNAETQAMEVHSALEIFSSVMEETIAVTTVTKIRPCAHKEHRNQELNFFLGLTKGKQVEEIDFPHAI